MIEITISSAIIIGLILGWFGNWSISAYYHRMCSHGSITIHEPLLTLLRIYTWLTQLGLTAPAWVGLHMMHHKHEDTEMDPYSPKFSSILTLWNVRAYKSYLESHRRIYIEGSKRCPRDAMERFFARHYDLGYVLFMVICLLLFSWVGIIIWGLTLASTILENALLASIGHMKGYQHQTNTSSRNVPFMFLFMVGEEWHNNHHSDPGNPNLGGKRWWEIDSGYLLICAFSKIGLITIRK